MLRAVPPRSKGVTKIAHASMESETKLHTSLELRLYVALFVQNHYSRRCSASPTSSGHVLMANILMRDVSGHMLASATPCQVAEGHEDATKHLRRKPGFCWVEFLRLSRERPSTNRFPTFADTF